MRWWIIFLPRLISPSMTVSEPGNPENTFEIATKDDAPLGALVFKIVTDPYVGRLAYIRVYSGVLTQGQSVMNSTKGRRNASDV